MACKTIKQRERKVCPGSMNDRIVIQNRVITAPDGSGSDFTEAFSTNKEVWAMIETRQGVEIFDGSNTVQVATHYFYIRYLSGLTSESWILFKSRRFDIIDIQDFEEKNEFMLLRCSERGTIDNLSNQA